MEIWQRDSPEGNRLLEAIQGYLSESGIEVKLVRREWSAFKEAVSAGRVDAFFLDWFADYPDAENFLFPLFHSSNTGGGGNRVSFTDPRVDDLIERASRSSDAGVSAALYARADSTVYAEAPWLYLYFPRSFHAISERVQGFRLPTLYLGADYSAVSKAN
jgi:ABC-type transport system substrate-binding protein